MLLDNAKDLLDHARWRLAQKKEARQRQSAAKEAFASASASEMRRKSAEAAAVMSLAIPSLWEKAVDAAYEGQYLGSAGLLRLSQLLGIPRAAIVGSICEGILLEDAGHAFPQISDLETSARQKHQALGHVREWEEQNRDLGEELEAIATISEIEIAKEKRRKKERQLETDSWHESPSLGLDIK